MSQAGIINVSGQSGVVDSVEGTAPIQVNGMSGTPQTGNVDVSITAATAGTSMTASLGAASFNSSNFSVVSGFVSLAGSGGAAIQTITGNTGGAELPDASGNFNFLTANSTVKFAGTPNTETLDFGLTNLILGSNASSITTASSNVGVGYGSLGALTTGNSNTSIGYGALSDCTTSSLNCAFGSSVLSSLTSGLGNNIGAGMQSLGGLTTGNNNICLGHLSGNNYTSSESSNLLLSNKGVLGESNVIRIGTQGTSSGQQNTCYIAGITGATPTSGNTPQVVVCDNMGNLTPISSSTSGYVLTSNGTATPSFQASGGGGSATAFFAYLNPQLSNVMGGASPGPYTIVCNNTTRNDGPNYSTSTGLFTAPKTGFYCFCATIYLNSTAGFTVGTEVLVSSLGSVSSNVHYQKLTIDATNTLTNTCLPFTWMLNMIAGDTMGIAAYCNNANQDVNVIGNPPSSSFFQTYTSFSGFLVGT
jgi:hypothetical protein